MARQTLGRGSSRPGSSSRVLAGSDRNPITMRLCQKQETVLSLQSIFAPGKAMRRLAGFALTLCVALCLGLAASGQATDVNDVHVIPRVPEAPAAPERAKAE